MNDFLGFQNDESSEEYFGQTGNGTGTDVGLSPPVGNLAASAIITTNATCGQKEPETFCKLVEHVNSRSRSSQCQICDAHSPVNHHSLPLARKMSFRILKKTFFSFKIH